MKKHLSQDIAADFLLSWLFSFSLLWGVFQSIQYRFSVGLMAVYVVVFTLLIVLMLRLPHMFLAVFLLLLIVVLLWEIPTFRDPERVLALIESWTGFVSWAYASLTTNIPHPPPEYLRRAFLLLSVGTPLIFGLLVRIRTHPAVLMLAGGALFFIQETYNQALFFPAFFLYLFCLTLYTLRQSYAGRRKRVQQSAAPLRFLAGAVPLCLLAVGLSMLMPTQGIPLSQPVLAWAGERFNMGDSVMPPETEKFASYGGLRKRNGGDELGGPLRRNNTLLFLVQAERPTYLRANVYDTYTGRAWQSENDDYRSFSRLEVSDNLGSGSSDNTIGPMVLRIGKLPILFPTDHGTLANGYQLLNGAVLTFISERGLVSPLDKLFEWEEGTHCSLLSRKPDHIVYREQVITFQNIHTASLFLPLEAVDLTLLPSGPGPTTPNVERSEKGEMRMSAVQGQEFSYRVETCDLGLTREELGDLLRREDSDYTNERMIVSDEGYVEDMRRYAWWQARQVQAGRYTALPDALPDRVTALAREIVEELPTDYDRALAIETYLRTTFPYDLDVPNTPPDRDFTDWFLFDQKRGYCTYYATAMTVLCRAVNIPARYVEGFTTPLTDTTSGQYQVTGEQAHAWCEVFFPGFGWVTFEPTASFEASFEETYFSQDLSSPTPAPAPIPSEAPTPPDANQERPVEQKPQPGGILWAALAVLVVTGSCPAVQSVRRGRLRRGKGRPSLAVERLFARTVVLARCLGTPVPLPAETPLGWARRVDESLDAPPDAAFVPVSEHYSRLRYGPDKPSAKDVRALCQLQEILLSKWKKDFSRTKYLLYRHYWGQL